MPAYDASLESRTGGGTEPGSVDNRLSLDPNNPDWKDAIADWEDGQEYSLTVKVTQLSPGEFEVIEVAVEEGSPPEEAAPEEEIEPAAGPKVNRAVRGMMGERM